MKKLPVYQLVLGDSAIEGVQANALVEDPANGFAFLAFSKDAPEIVKLAADAMKRNVTGVLLAPDQRIYRRDQKRGEYEVFFSKENIEAIVKNFSKNLRFGSVNLEHEVPVQGVHMIESWLTGDPDKAKALGFDVPAGTWMATFHVENDEIWEAILAGVFKGFSIEGLFGLQLVEMTAEIDEQTECEAFLTMLQDDAITDEEKIQRTKKLILK